MKVDNRDVAARIGQSSAIWQSVRRAEPTLQIRQIMREKNLRNIDIAERLGISEANVSRLLRGNQNLKLDTLYGLADALEEPLTIFFGVLQANSIRPESSAEKATAEHWNTNLLGSNNVINMSAYRSSRNSRAKSDGKERSRYGSIAISR